MWVAEMSYGITAFRIEFGRLLGIPGSADVALRDKLTRLMPDVDEVFDDDEADGSWGPKAAMSSLIETGALTHDQRAVGGYILCALYREFGVMMDNGVMSMVTPSFFEILNRSLSTAGLEAAVPLFNFGRCSPLPIPAPDDWPFFGYMTAAEVEAATGRLEAGDWSACHPDQQAALSTVAGWLVQAREAQQGIVVIYS
jgi:hypothetical protein